MTPLYTVPAATSAVTSTLVACNRGAVIATFRVSVAIGGAGDADAQYILDDVTLDPKQSRFLTLGTTHEATDVVRVFASTANVSFNLFGTEIV